MHVRQAAVVVVVVWWWAPTCETNEMAQYGAIQGRTGMACGQTRAGSKPLGTWLGTKPGSLN